MSQIARLYLGVDPVEIESMYSSGCYVEGNVVQTPPRFCQCIQLLLRHENFQNY